MTIITFQFVLYIIVVTERKAMNVLQKMNKQNSINSPMSTLFLHHCFQKHVIIKQYLWSVEDQLSLRCAQNNVLKADGKVNHRFPNPNPNTNKKPYTKQKS